MSEPVKVDIWSDIACPWCYVGKRRFEKAISQFDGEVEIEFHSFELAPDTPVDFAGSEIDFLAKHKGMPVESVRAMLAQMTEVAAAEGLNYDFDGLQHTKTLLAHQALHFAKEHGKQSELKERLLSAYFEEGRHVGRIDELVELGSDVGLDADALRVALTDERHANEVQADIEQAQAFGIQGVPFFVFDGKYGVSGAQEPDAFVDVLNQVIENR